MNCLDCGIAIVRTNTFGPTPKRCPAHRQSRANNIRFLYNMSLVEWDRRLAEQGGLCAVCRCKPATATDHDWYTDAVRGLLCKDCNTGLGHLGDDSAGAHAALRYLALHEGAFQGAGL